MKSKSPELPQEDKGFPRGYEEHRRQQALLGLSLTHAERLRWLNQTMATMRRWQGRAQKKTAKEKSGLASVMEAQVDVGEAQARRSSSGSTSA